jgi:hypothetical protein
VSASAFSAFSIVYKVVSVSCDNPAEKCTIGGDDERRAFYIYTNSRNEPAVGLADIRFTAGRSPDGDISGGGGLRVYTSRIDINGCEFSSNVARYDTFNEYTGASFSGRGTHPPARACERNERKNSDGAANDPTPSSTRAKSCGKSERARQPPPSLVLAKREAKQS